MHFFAIHVNDYWGALLDVSAKTRALYATPVSHNTLYNTITPFLHSFDHPTRTIEVVTLTDTKVM